MTRTRSAGLLLCRPRPIQGAPGFVVELLLVHPGGPYFANRDAGAWTIPKGLIEPGEQPLAAALREFGEETGLPPPPGPFYPLGSILQAGGKQVEAWAAVGDVDPATLRSNLFELEWPPRSGIVRRFPEIDRAGWFVEAEARIKLIPAQLPLIDRALALLSSAAPPADS